MSTFFTITLLSIFSLIFAQDEFFQPGSSIGGYGELHWNKANDSDGNSTKNEMDFHRFIIYYGYNWTDKWSFKSEVELEHNFVASGGYDADENKNSGYGEVELEQAYVNYHTGSWGFQGGVILPTAGLLNEYHEPPLFLSVERPAYSKYIIPTTWFGNGIAFYGDYSGFNFRFVLLEDLEGEDISSSGIRRGRGKGFKTTGYSLLKNMSVVYTGINGLRLGGSLSMNDAPYENNADTSISVQLIEANAKYFSNNIYAILEYGTTSFTGNKIDAPLKSSSGYYLDFGYNIGGFINTNKLIPWVRISNVSKNDDDLSKQTDYLRFGITWWPIDDVAFKTDFANVTMDGTTTTEFNLGIGYKF